MSIVIYGSSDDLIEVEGDVEHEFNIPGGDSWLLGLSNGVQVAITYTGTWNIRVKHMPEDGQVVQQLIPHDGEDSDNYSDRLLLEGGPTVVWTMLVADDE